MRRSDNTGRIALIALLLTVCGPACAIRARLPVLSTPSTRLQTNLNRVFVSPTGLYTLRYNDSWPEQQVVTEAGTLDLFTLPNGTFSIEAERVLSGTQLDPLIDQMVSQYRNAKIQGVERAGSIDVGGGHGELLRALTYVTAQGTTVASPPSPDAKPRNLYQAFYLAGDRRFTFSVAWPASDASDYLSLFRSILRTFTLAGTS